MAMSKGDRAGWIAWGMFLFVLGVLWGKLIMDKQQEKNQTANAQWEVLMKEQQRIRQVKDSLLTECIEVANKQGIDFVMLCEPWM